MKQVAVFFVGSWLRAITTAIVAINLAVIGLASALLFSTGQTLFRVDAVSDSVSFVTVSALEWGAAPVRAIEGGTPLCPEAGLRVPAETSVQATRTAEGVSISLNAVSKDRPILVKCSAADIRAMSFVEVWLAVPRFPSATGNKLLTGRQFLEGLSALRSEEPPRATVPISGKVLRIGGGGDPDSPLVDTPLLRSGTLSSETASSPLQSAAVIVDRTLQPGDIVSFDQPAAGPSRENGSGTAGISPRFTGILLVEDNKLRIVARTQTNAALVTSPNAIEGKPAIIAPNFLVRLQSQAEWGVFILIGGLVLGIFNALRALVLEDEKMFDWTKRPRRPRAKSKAAKGVAAVIVCAMIWPIVSQPASAQSSLDHPVFRIEVKGGGFGQGFAILNPRGRPNCLIVTASHVVRAGDEITLVGEQPNSATGQALPIRANAHYLDEIAPGLIVLEPEPSASLGNCAPMPQPARSDAAFEADAFGRLTYAADNGERLSVKVVVDGVPALSRRLTVTGFTREQISAGMSGSPFSINGKILAVANSVSGGATELIRLDTADIKPAYVAAAPAAQALWSPAFDVSRLPKEYADVALAARALANEAATVASTANANAERGEAAARVARDGMPGFGTGSLAEKDRVFEGKIDMDGVPNGWGVLRFIDGPRVGDEVKGYFRRNGTSFTLSGAGVTIFAAPAKNNNHRRWEVSWNPGANGPGVMYYADGSVVWTSWQNGQNNSVQTYQRGSDKSGFEVMSKDGRMNGPGVLWSTAGQPLCICVWKDGSVIKDETKKYLANKP